MIQFNKKIVLYDCFEKWLGYDDIVLYSNPHFSDLESYKLRFQKKYDGHVSIAIGWVVNELDEMQISNINKIAGKKSILIILGDVGNIECVKKLHAGRKILIQGNHDLGASNYKRKITEVEDLSKPGFYGDVCLRDNQVERIFVNDIDTLMNLGAKNIEKGFAKKKVDNHLFDEVYEGPLTLNEKIILSHEKIKVVMDVKGMAGTPVMMNCHGHDHSCSREDNFDRNYCAENINFTPVRLADLITSGALNKIYSIHRETIDRATERKAKSKVGK